MTAGKMAIAPPSATPINNLKGPRHHKMARAFVAA